MWWLARAWAWLLGVFRALCGLSGGHPKSDIEESPLLAADSDASVSPRAPALSRQPVHVPTPEQADRKVIVMRHGHRQDEEDPLWHRTAKRPWDPPLSAKGRAQAREVAHKMRGMHLDYVITSPFRRCMQTSAEIVAELGMAEGTWLVDWAFSEVCDPRMLFAGRPEVARSVGKQQLLTWMWDGASLDDALLRFQKEDAKLAHVNISAQVHGNCEAPAFPETLERGLRRYGKGIRAVMEEFTGKNVLIVSHGEAVRQAVVMMQPQSEVFEVQHTAYVVLQPRVPPAAEENLLGTWLLATEAGDTGVMWFDD